VKHCFREKLPLATGFFRQLLHCKF